MKTEIIKAINQERKAAGNNWFTFSATYQGKLLQLKAYKTWVQRIEYNGWTDSGVYDISVKQFNLQLEKWLS